MIRTRRWDPETGQIIERQLTLEEFREEKPEIAAAFESTAPGGDEPQGYLQRKMQSEQDTNEALARAGIESLDDLAVEGDDASIPIDDLEPREYDDAGAAADLEARQRRDGA